jgi:tetratricopeptide (TPR) repeat protein
VLVAALSLLAVATPLADDPDYAAGVTLYQEIELEQAIERFAKAADGDRSDEDRAICWAWVGLSHGQLGRLDNASVAFGKAVGAHLDVALPAAAPPEIGQLLEDARAAEREQLAALAPEPEPAPAPEPEPTPTPVWVTHWPTIASVGTASLGVLAVGTAGVVAVLGLDKGMRQSFEVEFNSEANRLVDEMYTDLAVAGVVTVVGLGAMGAAVGFLFAPSPE